VTGRAFLLIKTSASKPVRILSWRLMAGYSLKYHVAMKSFSQCCEDDKDKDDWRMRIHGGNQLTQVYLENGR